MRVEKRVNELQSEFTHRLDTRKNEERLINVKSSWQILVKYFLLRGYVLSVRYFPGDVKRQDNLASGFGIAELEKYVITKKKLNDHTIEISCPLIPEVSDIVLSENPNPDSICSLWDLKIITEDGKTIFYSHDWGSGTLLELTSTDLEILIKQGINPTYLITPAFVSADCTRIINGIPQFD